MKFCLVGTGRCGSTVLTRMLNYHPDVFVFNETHWVPKMHEIFGSGKGYPDEFMRVVEKTFHITGSLVTNIDRHKVLSLFEHGREISLRAFCDGLGKLIADDHGKQYWADKTPDYGPWLGVIKKHWPECKFIHLVRHGADVAASMSRHPGYQWMASAGEDSWVPASYNHYYKAVPIVEKPLEDYAALWYRRFRRIRNEVVGFEPESYKEFRFESFATKPESTLKDIADFVGLKTTDDWLSRSVQELDVTRLTARISTRSLDYMSEREMRLLRELGYE